MSRIEQQTVPRSALCFAAEFAPGESITSAAADGSTLFPFDMVARTGGVAHHPYWGRCIHDFAGMLQPKPSITVDYCHNPADVIGYADRLVLRDNVLTLGGALVSLREGDRAFEVAGKRKAGVPYEASILTNAEGLQVEFIPEGFTADVNGQTVAGPLNVFRRWELWGVAVLPYGSDADTSIQFGAAGEGVAVAIIRQAEAPALASAMSPTRTGPEYLAMFGDQGGVWFAQGRPFEECYQLFAADARTETAARDQRIGELSDRIGQLTADLEAAKAEYRDELQKREDEHQTALKVLNANFANVMGGMPPRSVPPAVPETFPAPLGRQFSGLTENQARFAAAIRLPVPKAISGENPVQSSVVDGP